MSQCERTIYAAESIAEHQVWSSELSSGTQLCLSLAQESSQPYATYTRGMCGQCRAQVVLLDTSSWSTVGCGRREQSGCSARHSLPKNKSQSENKTFTGTERIDSREYRQRSRARGISDTYLGVENMSEVRCLACCALVNGKKCSPLSRIVLLPKMEFIALCEGVFKEGMVLVPH